MQQEPKEWESDFRQLLEEQAQLCEQLCDSSKLLRDELVKRRFSSARFMLAELQKQNNLLCRSKLLFAKSAQDWGLIAPGEEFKLSRLLVHETILRLPDLRQHLIAVAQAVQRTAREAELNKRLFQRLLEWNQKEVRIFTEPLTDIAGYGAMGSVKEGKPRPALLDRRG